MGDHKKRGFYGGKSISSKCLLGSNPRKFCAKDRRVSRTWSYKPSEDTTDGFRARSGQSVGTGFSLPRTCYLSRTEVRGETEGVGVRSFRVSQDGLNRVSVI